MITYQDSFTKIGAQTVLCIGDLMLDEFVYGDVSRISPEAPAPVLAITRSEVIVGGAGNVARNVASLGARCLFVAVVGEDETGRRVTQALAQEAHVEPYLVVDRSRVTTRKMRFVSDHFSTHLLRADWELSAPVGDDVERSLIRHVEANLSGVGAVILSDYAKGALTRNVIRAVIAAARKAGVPVLVDPKGADFSIYRGATVITPNRQELAQATRMPVGTHDEVAAAARALAGIVEAEAVVVTRSEEGMSLVPSRGDVIHVPAYPVKVSDVSGAGDTVVATLAVMLAAGADLEDAMRAANAAAAVVVGKRGTASLSLVEMRARLLAAASRAAEEKIVFDWSMLEPRLADWRRQGLRIGFTNGCFDILHPGHVALLAEARSACDRLIVGLNSDASVARLKGPTRPLQDEMSRANVLAALEAVDLVVIFPQDTPLELLERVRPMVLVKGGDYRPETVVGRDLVEAAGGEVVIVDLLGTHSTTALVKRMADKRGGDAKD